MRSPGTANATKDMFKSLDKWLFGYLTSILRRPRHQTGLRHLIVAVCDHYEPYRGGTDRDEARRIVKEWTEAYPAAVEGFHDADGCPPRHTFFYPEEEYDEEILSWLAAFCRQGFGEVEIHLHHRNDTAEGFREKLVRFRDLLHERHGLLGEGRMGSRFMVKGEEFSIQNPESRIQDSEKNKSITVIDTQDPRTLNHEPSPIRYGFIHGNWALCNSRPDGDWCGVNEELGVLAETGCYADFTFPSAPSPTQPRMVNDIYYARDTGRPRAADRGGRVRVQGSGVEGKGEESRIRNSESRIQEPDKNGSITAKDNSELRTLNPEPCSTSLLLITGPLALNWRRRKWGVLPRLENSDICGSNPPTPDRVRLWVDQGIGVIGRPDWVFVKLHTHGCVPANARVLLGEKMRAMHETLQREFNDGSKWQLHYVTAREMYNLVKAAEAGKEGSPGQWRDWLVGRPTGIR